jgi:hypothetical protein
LNSQVKSRAVKRDARPGEAAIRRHIGVDPIPATAWANAVFAGYTPEESRTDDQRAAQALAATLTDELIVADALLFAVPLYNLGVSQFTLVGVNPALDQFKDMARELREESEELARRHGREPGAALTPA